VIARSLSLAGLLLLLSTTGLSLPRYDMGWGEFSHRLLLDPPAFSLAPGRRLIVLCAGAGAFLLLVWSFLRLGREAGRGLSGWLIALLLLSTAASVPLPRPGGACDAQTLLYALRATGVGLLVVGAGILLGRPLGVTDRFLVERTRPPLAGLAVVILAGTLAMGFLRLDAIPHAMDEITQVFQARIFASGRLWAQAPPLPDLISHFSVLAHDGKWHAAAPPGHALVMSPFVAAGIPWLYPPVLAALAFLAITALIDRIDGRRTALLAGLLLLTSPWFWSMGSTYMSHLPAALWLACFLACLVRARSGSARAAAGAGLALGAAVATRPSDALFLSAPFGVLWLLDAVPAAGRRGWLLRSAALALGLLPGLAVLLGINTLVHGGPFVFGHDLLFEGRYRFGFGAKPPGILLDPLATPVHTFAEGLANLRGLLADLQTALFGIGVPSLALVAAGAARSMARLVPDRASKSSRAPSARESRDRFGAAAVIALALYLGAYVLSPLDMTMFGPRYAFAALPLFVLLGARGLAWAGRRLADAGSPRALAGILAAGTVVAAVDAMPTALRSFGPGFAGVDRHLDRALGARGSMPALIIVPEDPRALRGNPFVYTGAFRLTDPDLRGIVAARYRGSASVQTALDAFPNHEAYAWVALYQGDFHVTRFETASLVRLWRPSETGFRPEREAAVRRVLEAYESALADRARPARVYNLLGSLAWLDADPDTARRRLARAVSLEPRDPEAWVNLALLEKAEGRLDAARRAARNARALGFPLPPPLERLLPEEDGGPGQGSP
jgi:4-amino-4-deoxy-L-arabinose transferase-like glycosyltransferase